jgi:hypothetical protein
LYCVINRSQFLAIFIYFSALNRLIGSLNKLSDKPI